MLTGRLWGGIPVRSAPSSDTLPLDGASNPANIRINCGFSASRRAQQRKEFALIDIKRQIIHRGEITKSVLLHSGRRYKAQHQDHSTAQNHIGQAPEFFPSCSPLSHIRLSQISGCPEPGILLQHSRSLYWPVFTLVQVRVSNRC